MLTNSSKEEWETLYDTIMNPKYKKNTRNFSRVIHGHKTLTPHIYLIPRIRGTSYKNIHLTHDEPENIQFCPISKGYSMQNVSSFTIGPVVGEGLCLVNAAFSKAICIMHLCGGGRVNTARKNYWQSSKKPIRHIIMVNPTTLSVDGVEYNTYTWLDNNLDLWFDEWNTWRSYIALTSVGDFHWTDKSDIVCYRAQDKYLNFVEWKKECYIKPAYDLLPQTDVFQFLKNMYESGISLGLVHPMGKDDSYSPMTPEYIRALYDDPYDMSCMPYCVVGLLLGVSI